METYTKPEIIKIGTFSRMLTVPKVTDDLINLIKDIEGIEKSELQVAGQYEILYSVDVSYDENLVDDNLLFLLNEYYRKNK